MFSGINYLKYQEYFKAIPVLSQWTPVLGLLGELMKPQLMDSFKHLYFNVILNSLFLRS